MRNSATGAVNSSDFRLEFQCPQCGAPVTIVENDRLFACPFCKVKHIIHSTSHWCFYLPAAQGVHSQIYYVPYWRFKGIEYRRRNNEVTGTIIDRSAIAFDVDEFPPFLGFKAQIHRAKLRMATPDVNGYFLPFTLHRDEFMSRMERGIAGSRKLGAVLNQGNDGVPAMKDLLFTLQNSEYQSDRYIAQASRNAMQRSAMQQKKQGELKDYIGEVLSIIYYPYYFDGYHVYDGISQQQISMAQFPDKVSQKLLRAPRWTPCFLPTLCPNCGWDLTGQADSFAYQCKHCCTLWSAGSGELKQLSCAILQTAHTAGIYLPYWCFRFRIAGQNIESYADLIRNAYLAKVPTPEMEKLPCCIFVPAFKIAPRPFLKYAFLMSSRPVELPAPSSTVPEHTFALTLPMNEGRAAVPLVAAQLFRRNKDIAPAITKESVEVFDARLVLIPFVCGGYEYTQPELNFAVIKNTVQWGKML
ncbi:MAG: hypothetical protein GF398_14840 [Chitinivibrionales bacterium]|nr:hypothetical protein [Chitinivibrionales bacterium]